MKAKHDQDKLKDANAKDYARLPCRGCLASCKNYHHCDGKLWRMTK